MFANNLQPQPRYTIQEAAAVLRIPANQLFQRLRQHRILSANNVPNWRHKELGYFIEREHVYNHPAVGAKPYSRTFVTADGLDWLQYVFLARMYPVGGDAQDGAGEVGDSQKTLYDIASCLEYAAQRVVNDSARYKHTPRTAHMADVWAYLYGTLQSSDNADARRIKRAIELVHPQFAGRNGADNTDGAA